MLSKNDGDTGKVTTIDQILREHRRGATGSDTALLQGSAARKRRPVHLRGIEKRRFILHHFRAGKVFKTSSNGKEQVLHIAPRETRSTMFRSSTEKPNAARYGDLNPTILYYMKKDDIFQDTAGEPGDHDERDQSVGLTHTAGRQTAGRHLLFPGLGAGWPNFSWGGTAGRTLQPD